MMDFKKAYDRVDRETIEQTMRKMNYGENILKLIKLLYTGSQATIITNEMKGEQFKTKGGVKQGCPLSPYLFIIALELMAIEIRKEKAIKGIELTSRNKQINSVSNKDSQPDNIDDRISLFADDSSTIITEVKQIPVVRENIHQYEKGTGSALHEGKTKIIRIGSGRRRHLTPANMKTNFTIMEDNESEKYLGDMIGNMVTEEQTYDKTLEGIEKLGKQWIKQNIGIHGRTIVANVLLQSKMAHKASVNGMSKRMSKRYKQKIKEFIWGGENKKARVIWEIMLKTPAEGGTGIRDPVIAIEARRINLLKKLIIQDRQPWMKWVERKLTRIAQKWKINDIMAAKPSRKEIKELKETCLVETTIKIWYEIGGKKQEERYVEETYQDNIIQKWESGYGIEKEEKWIPIEKLNSKIVYETLQKAREQIKNYTPNKAHKTLYEIDTFLSSEERFYWWRLTHKIVSTKKSESKYKRDEKGDLVSPICPICQEKEEDLEHYNNGCIAIKTFKEKLAEKLEHDIFSDEEWSLKTPTDNRYVNIYIAKARWAFHCERCNVDHRRRRKINYEVVLNRTQKRMELIENILIRPINKNAVARNTTIPPENLNNNSTIQ